MSASAEHFRQASLRTMAALSAEERVLRALALGQCDLEIYAAVSGLTLDEAREAHRRRCEVGRRGSRTGAP